jgi:hypothetical protein
MVETAAPDRSHYRRLSLAHCAVCAALDPDTGDPALPAVCRLLVERWGDIPAVYDHTLNWLVTDHGLTREQALALPLPELLARLRAGQRSSTREPDTPLPWAGDDWDELMPQTRRLLRHMHGRERDEIAHFAEIVWERPYERISDSAVHAAVSRANHFLNKHRHPHMLSKVRGEPVIRWL